jgi:PilZ domain-containing protein
MADLRFLKPLERVELRWRTYGGEYVVIPGQIQEIGQDTILLWYNRNAPTYQAPEAAQELEIGATTANGIGLIPATVRNRVPIDLMEVVVTGEPVWTQRRQYVREFVSLPVTPATLVSSDEDPSPTFPIRFRDLSGGGISAWCQRQLARGDRVEVTIELGDGPPLTTEVTLVECVDEPQPPVVRGQEFPYVLRGPFSNLLERDRRRLVQYVFRLQVARRRVTG